MRCVAPVVWMGSWMCVCVLLTMRSYGQAMAKFLEVVWQVLPTQAKADEEIDCVLLVALSSKHPNCQGMRLN